MHAPEPSSTSSTSPVTIPRQVLAAAVDARDHADCYRALLERQQAHLEHLVLRLRVLNVDWRSIARTLRMSKSTCHRRFGFVDEVRSSGQVTIGTALVDGRRVPVARHTCAPDLNLLDLREADSRALVQGRWLDELDELAHDQALERRALERSAPTVTAVAL